MHYPDKGPNAFNHNEDETTTIVLERRDGSTMNCIIDTSDYDLVKGYRWYAGKFAKLNLSMETV